jgi:glucokinase
VSGGRLLGIDIGGTKLAVGVATRDGTVLAERVAPSEAREGPDAMIGRVLDMARSVVDEAGVAMDQLDAVGIACGGPLDPWRGVVLNALNNPGWIDIPIVRRVEEALGRPAYLDNDANAAALGEHRFGAGRGVDQLVYLTVSTGVGGGVILDGRLRRGANGNAAELGHVSIDYRGRPCHCGSVGCVEAYCSGTNIAVRAREALAVTGEASSLRDVPSERLTAADVTAAVRVGDPLAQRIWGETTTMLGAGIVSIIHAFNPQLVVMGGGVTRAGDLLFEPVRRVVEGRAMPWLRDAVRIVPAELGERTGILGAVAVALDGPDLAATSPSTNPGRTDA